jgi:hypothetical protein
MIPHPPQIGNYEVKHNTTLRFTTTAAISQQITYDNLLDTVVMPVTAILAYDLFYAVKIRRIKVWALPVIGQSNSIAVIFDATATGFVGDRKVHQDSSMGIEPAFLNVAPEKDSLASKFQVASANNAFFIEAPTGSVIDVELTYRSDVLGGAIAAQNATVGATIGAIAYRGLDGLAKATSNYAVPTSFNSV